MPSSAATSARSTAEPRTTAVRSSSSTSTPVRRTRLVDVVHDKEDGLAAGEATEESGDRLERPSAFELAAYGLVPQRAQDGVHLRHELAESPRPFPHDVAQGVWRQPHCDRTHRL